MTPGRKFSTTTSAVTTRRRTASTAGGVLRSRTMLFFPALSCPKLVLAPLRSGGRVRIMSPSGASILITSAPRSANSRVQCGPAIVVVKSSTRTRSSAPVIIGLLAAQHIEQGSGQRAGNVKPRAAVGVDTGLLLAGFGAKRAAGILEGGPIWR